MPRGINEQQNVNGNQVGNRGAYGQSAYPGHVWAGIAGSGGQPAFLGADRRVRSTVHHPEAAPQEVAPPIDTRAGQQHAAHVGV